MIRKFIFRRFSTFRTTEFLNVVDLSKFLLRSNEAKDLCSQVAESLQFSGVLLVKDPRANFSDNDQFINLFEQYFASRSALKSCKVPVPEMFPENGYNTGVTPDYIEKPRENIEFLKTLAPEFKPKTPFPPQKDPKWRYLWRIGERDPNAKKSSIEPERVAPKDFPEFASVVDKWGDSMLRTVSTVARNRA